LLIYCGSEVPEKPETEEHVVRVVLPTKSDQTAVPALQVVLETTVGGSAMGSTVMVVDVETVPQEALEALRV
jgi:hypothetical protein